MFLYIYNFFLYNSLIYNLLWLLYDNNNRKRIENTYNLIKKSGVVGIKFCQWFIYNTRLNYDSPLLDKFEEFYENCEYHCIEETEKIFYKDFNFNIYDLLDFEDKTPIASGSIGQVYKCKLKNSNKYVALKVKHPYIEYQIYYPIFLIKCFNFILKTFFKNYHIPLNINQFFIILKEQLNFNIEYHNANHFKNIFKDNKLIKIPEPYISSENIYISEYVEGKYFEDYKDLSHYKKCKIALAFILLNRQLLSINGLMHADLHKGNWKINYNNDNEFNLVLYDFGFCFQCNPDYLNNIWLGWEISDKKLIAQTFIDIIKNDNPKLNYDNIYNKILCILDDILEKPINFSIIIQKVYNYLILEKVILNGNVINFFIIILLLDKIIKNYDLIDDYQNKLDNNLLSDNYFKSDYLNYIHFCEYYDSFNELKYFLQEKLNKYSCIDDIFFCIDKKIGIEETNDKINENIILEL